MTLPKILAGTAYSAYEVQLEKEVRDGGPVPKHMAIIMDGNRRYAAEVLMAGPKEGHIEGRKKLEEVLEWCILMDVRYLTVFAFSTDNFNRDQDEVVFLMELISQALRDFADNPRVHENKVRIALLGDRGSLPDNVLEAVGYADSKTAGYSNFCLNMAVAYGGRQEIINAVREVVQEAVDGKIRPEDVTESMLSRHMYTGDTPDPDMILRTSGEVRISNFLLWQMAYSELYFSDVYWPGFRYIDFLRAIRSYQQRHRRYGR